MIFEEQGGDWLWQRQNHLKWCSGFVENVEGKQWLLVNRERCVEVNVRLRQQEYIAT